jgi:hypothetical protein
MATKSNRATAGRPGAAKGIKSTVAGGPCKPKLPNTPDPCMRAVWQAGAGQGNSKQQRTIFNAPASVAQAARRHPALLGCRHGQHGRRPC